jgi:hypothetical protein
MKNPWLQIKARLRGRTFPRALLDWCGFGPQPLTDLSILTARMPNSAEIDLVADGIAKLPIEIRRLESPHPEYLTATHEPALRAKVSRVSILPRGGVSVVLRFDPIDRERAQKLTPGTVVEIK